MFTRWVAFLTVFLLPLSSAAQSSREAQAEEYIQAAKQAQANGDFSRAVAGYLAAVKLMPEVPELYNNLGIAYYYEKDYEKAIASFQNALKGKHVLPGANLFLGLAYVRTSQFEQSIKPLEKAIALDPKVREAYINLSGSFQELGKDEEAVQVLQRAARIFPDDPEVLYCLGSLHYHLMFKAYGRMAKVAPNSYRYNQVMGRSFEARQEYPAAIIEFQNAIKDNPRAPGLHYDLGDVFWLQGRYTDARREFEAELEISPEDYMSTWKLGSCYIHERQFDKAMPYLQKAIRVKPDLEGALEDLGKLYVETNDNERALFYLNKVVEMDPSEPSPHYLLSRAYRHMGMAEEAQAEMAKFEKLKREEGERRRPPAAMFADTDHESEKSQPPAAADSNDPQN